MPRPPPSDELQRQLRRFQSDASGRVVVEVHLLPPPPPPPPPPGGSGGSGGEERVGGKQAETQEEDAAAMAAVAWAARLRVECGDGGASLQPRSPSLLHALLTPAALEVSSESTP